jgi:K+-transporting ATPase ATPase A chain
VTGAAWLQLALYLAALAAVAWPLSRAIAALIDRRVGWLARIEAPIWRLAGVDPAASMPWTHYALALLAFNGLGVVAVYLLQRLQGLLPLNPQGFGAIAPDSALNTAVSFVTNTNWQGYAGEQAMSHLVQMAGLGVQNFVSAATGIAVAFVLIRGFAQRASGAIGHFWVDVTRITLWLLLPLAFGFALVLAGLGVVQTFAGSVEVPFVESPVVQQPQLDAAGQPVLDAAGRPVQRAVRIERQALALGPVASQEAIKMLGTNGGGFFNANSAHPFENPSATSNALQMLSIFAIPAALVLAFGRVVGDRRQGFAVLAAMTVLFVAAVVATTGFEQAGNPLIASLGVDDRASALQAGGNMEGKETRFGIAATALFAVLTTAASCGAVIGMHDAFTPLGGLVPMWLIQLGEVVFGGVGAGLYGMLVFALLAVFLAGLMVGRTPEYLGKKIERFEMQMASVAILVTPLLVLFGTALAVSTEAGRAGIANPGPHGFSEMLYSVSSAANNNGSAFAGLSANTPFWNGLLAVAMWLGRFGVIVPVLAIAGRLAHKPRLDPGPGTLPTHGPLFVVLLIATVLLVGALTFVPALVLGPVAEHLSLSTATTGASR